MITCTPPKFAVGERAILKSISCPMVTMTVEVVRWKYTQWRGRYFGEKFIGYGYWVTPSPSDNGAPFAETCLHKIPPLADQSFDQIMKELKSPVPEGNETA